MKIGRTLIDEIDATRVAPGDAVFWWLGQHSYVVRTASAVLWFDPFLSDNAQRLIPALVKPEEVTNATVVFGSHDHGDHIDRESLPGIATASPGARFVVPRVAKPPLVALGIPEQRVIALDAEEVWETDGCRVVPVAAAHEFFDHDESTGYPYLGFIVESGGVTVYHAGDTLRYEGLETRLCRERIDIAFLPINGRDGKRLAAGCIGNMTFQEAADLAGAMRPRLAVAGHYEMFASNAEDPALFVDYMRVKYPDIPVRVGPHGTAIRLSETSGT